MASGSSARRLRLSILSVFDPWNSPLCYCPIKYSLNPYTGCSFECIYCYATSYIGVKPSTPKKAASLRLERDIAKIPPGSIINIGTSSDPYPEVEENIGVTRRILERLIPEGFRILITTKGTLYAWRDLDLIASGNVAVTPTITGLDSNEVLRIVESGAPSQGERLSAAREASRAGVPIAVRIDPIIPYVNDDPHEIRELVSIVADLGARMIITSTFKARRDSLARIRRVMGPEGESIYRLYTRRGVWVHGYLYLPRDDREALLEPVVSEARKLGLEYATCREGLSGPEWFKAGSCDGSHLIPMRIRPRSGLAEWMEREA
ncbi:MAG: radical SAM protein [Aeropyrum sp.]|nr:radical SAM protein [Aeropyrum sp.]